MIGDALLAKIQAILANPAWFAIYAILVVVSITLHEWGHAVMAVACGDPTPRAQGRVTLNPLAHLDPVGTIGIFFFGFGWGKPVMVTPSLFRNKRWDDVKVAAAGPAMNLFQALVFAVALRAVWQLQLRGPVLAQILGAGLMINVGLMVFNLIPVGPLDGATVFRGLLPPRAAYDFYRFNQQWGMLVMIALLLTGTVGSFIEPVQALFHRYITWGMT